MDNIWDRKSFEVGGHWPLWRGWKKRMAMQNRQKSNAKRKKGYIRMEKKVGNKRKILISHDFSARTASLLDMLSLSFWHVTSWVIID